MIKALTTLMLGLSCITAYAQGAGATSPEYRAWLYRTDCKDLTGSFAAKGQYLMGNQFFSVDVYVEMEKMGFKYTNRLLRADSLAKVDETVKRLAWLKANRSKYPTDSQLISATRRAVADESLGRYVQSHGIMDLTKLCECYNREKSKHVPSETDFKSKSQQLLAEIDIKAKASCMKSLYKTDSWF